MKTDSIFRAFLLALCLFGAALTPSASANDGVPLWTNRYDGPVSGLDDAYAVTVDSSGNVFVTGASYNGSRYNYATVAYSGAGVTMWTNRYNGPANSGDYANAIAVDGSGNVFVTGTSYSASADYATVGYSGAGVPLWTNRYNGPANSGDETRGIAVDGSGNVFVTGRSIGSGSGFDYATVAYSAAGVPLWTNRYNGPGNSDDQAKAMAVDSSGNVFVTGRSYSGVNNDYATVAYSGAGVPFWTNRYNGPGNSGDFAQAVVVDGGGNVFVTGTSDGIGSSADYATVAYSGAGVPLWTNRYNGPGNSDDAVSAMAVDRGGNVFVTGTSYNGSSYNYATVAYSGAGMTLWTNLYTGPGTSGDYANAVMVDGGGNVFVTGYSDGNGSGLDYATVAYSGAGVPIWTNRYNGPGNSTDVARAVAVDGSGNVFVTGYSSGSGSSDDYATIKYAALFTLTHAAATNGQFQFQFNAASNLTYAVEFRDFLNAGNWVTLTNIAAQPSATNLTITNAITNSARFYRVRTP